MGQFGYTQTGVEFTTTYGFAGTVQGVKVTATAAGTADSMVAYIAVAAATCTACCAIYQETGTLLAQTEQKTIVAGTTSIVFNFLDPKPSISATAYNLVVHGTGIVALVRGTAVNSPGTVTKTENYDGSYTASIAFTQITSGFLSLYCNYTDMGGGSAWTQALSDSITFTDTRISNVRKVLSDSSSITESLIKHPRKVVSDAITYTESTTKKPQKVVSDSSSVSETIAKKPQKVLSDTITIAESIAKLFHKVVSQNITVTESTVKKFFKVLSDSSVVTNTVVKNIFKNLSDSITVTETNVAGLVVSTAFIKTRYITGQKGIKAHELELMKQQLGKLSYRDIEILRQEFIGDIKIEDVQRMNSDLRELLKDWS